jgi:hypothetical protein
MAAKLAGEAASRAKRPADACDHELWPAHPVQRRIGEHRVEFILERKRVAVDLLHIEALGGSGGEQLLAQIGAKHIGAARGDFLREYAVATAKVEDAFALPRRQQIEHRTGKLGDETAFHRIVVGLPALHRLWRRHLHGAHSDGPGCQGS